MAAVVLGTAGAVLNRAAQFVAAEGPVPPTNAGIPETAYDLREQARAEIAQARKPNYAAEQLAVSRQHFDLLRRLAEDRGLIG